MLLDTYQNHKTDKPILGVIGGSGLYEMPGLQDIDERHVDTPFGSPSGPILVGRLEQTGVAFLARHGLGHHVMPTEVNNRANIYALKSLGVERIVSISACGSLRDDYAPGEIAIPDQLFDFTRARPRTFFGDGLVAHISIAEPFCPDLSKLLFGAVQATGVKVHSGGAMITIEGPRFSTRVESNVFRGWGMSLIGMTTSPEAFLAREAELCYTVMAHVTDFDVWHISEDPVTVEMVVEILHRNTKIAQEALTNLARSFHPPNSCACPRALADAVITRRDMIPAATLAKLELLVGKYIQ